MRKFSYKIGLNVCLQQNFCLLCTLSENEISKCLFYSNLIQQFALGDGDKD